MCPSTRPHASTTFIIYQLFSYLLKSLLFLFKYVVVGMKPEGSGPLELELREVGSYLIPVLGTELRSSGRAVSSLPESSLWSPLIFPDLCVLSLHDPLSQQLRNMLKI